MEEEYDADERHAHALLDELFLERLYGPLYEAGTVVYGDYLPALGQPLFKVLELPLHVLYDLQGVPPVAHDDNAPSHLALAVEVHEPPPHLRPRMHRGYVPYAYGRAPCVHANGYALYVTYALYVAEAPHHELGFSNLDGAPAHVGVAHHDGVFDLRKGDVVGEELRGVHLHLVLFYKAADARPLGNPGHRLELVPQVPVLNAT